MSVILSTPNSYLDATSNLQAVSSTPTLSTCGILDRLGVGVVDPQHTVHVVGDVVIYGSLSASGGSTFQNTVFSTTSALSVVNTGTGPALLVSQEGDQPIVAFYDHESSISLWADGHIDRPGYVGVKTINPNRELTVSGRISATGDVETSGVFIGDLNGNAATVTNGVYTTESYNNPTWLNTLNYNKLTDVPSQLPLSGGTLTGFISGTDASFSGSVSANTFVGNLSGTAATVANGVYTIGNQSISGIKTFVSTVSANISGNASTVTNGVYTTGNQSISGTKTFTSAIVGSLSGNADTVTNGVYTTGNQSIGGTKTFTSAIAGSITGNANTVTNGVYTSSNQSISGTKTFTSTIVGNISGNAGTVTNGVYTTGNQSISGTKTFTSTISANIAGTATNVAGGSANQVLYQVAANDTSYITAPTVSGTALTYNGSAFVWSNSNGILPSQAGHSGQQLITDGVSASWSAIVGVSAASYLIDGVTPKTNATGTVVHNCSAGHVFYHTTPNSNFTANLTNLNVTANKYTEVQIIIVQASGEDANAYAPTTIQISGVTQAVNYTSAGGNGHVGSTDVFNYKILNVSGGYVILGQVTQY